MDYEGGFDVGPHLDFNLQVNCTWGEAADVSFDITAPLDRLEGNHPRGYIPIDLTSEEAIEIGRMLVEAGEEAKRLSSEMSAF